MGYRLGVSRAGSMWIRAGIPCAALVLWLAAWSGADAEPRASAVGQMRIYPYPTSGVGVNRLPNTTGLVDSFQVANTGTSP